MPSIVTFSYAAAESAPMQQVMRVNKSFFMILCLLVCPANSRGRMMSVGLRY